MNEYKLIEVVKTAEKETQSLYDFEDIKSASDAMHNDFGVAVKANGTISVYCSIINNATAEIEENLYWYDREYEHPEEIEIRHRVYTHNDYQEDNIAAYDSERLALGNFHTKWATYSRNVDCHFAIIVKLDGAGILTDRMVKNENANE